MDFERINGLLEKYWSCETSLEEEKELRGYFDGREIPEPLKDSAALFRHFSDQARENLSDATFDQRVMRLANASKHSKVRTILLNSMRIAAGVIVLVVAIWLVRAEIRNTGPQEPTDTYSDPKLAFEETKRALMMISKSFGSAEQEAKKINLFNEAQQQVRKQELEGQTKL